MPGDKKVYSQTETIFYLGEKFFVVYPNPVAQGNNAIVLAADVSEDIQLQVFTISGQKIYETAIIDIQTTIPTSTFSKGLCIFRFIRKGEKDIVLKLLIQ